MLDRLTEERGNRRFIFILAMGFYIFWAGMGAVFGALGDSNSRGRGAAIGALSGVALTSLIFGLCAIYERCGRGVPEIGIRQMLWIAGAETAVIEEVTRQRERNSTVVVQVRNEAQPTIAILPMSSLPQRVPDDKTYEVDSDIDTQNAFA